MTLGEVTGIVAQDYTIDWGDGQTDTYTAAEIQALNGQVTHTFSSACCKMITVDLTDNAGGSYSGVAGKTTTVVKVSLAPTIGNFFLINEVGNYWTLTGSVTDNDDSVEGYVITFGGVLAGYHLTTTARIDGAFSLTVELIGLQQGTGTAQTRDPHGVRSNVALDYIIA